MSLQFLDLEFPEDEEEDKDYNPDTETETELSQPSDEEMSVFSDATGGFKSPRVLLTPLSVARSDVQTPTENSQEQCNTFYFEY